WRSRARENLRSVSQRADDIAVGPGCIVCKNAKARLDAELLRKWFAGIAGHMPVRPAAAAPGRDPDRAVAAACRRYRPAARRTHAAWSAQAPTRGSASCP